MLFPIISGVSKLDNICSSRYFKGKIYFLKSDVTKVSELITQDPVFSFILRINLISLTPFSFKSLYNGSLSISLKCEPG